MDQTTATDVLKAMLLMFASGDPSDAAAVVAADYLDHQGLGVGRADDRAVARIRWHGRRHDGEEVNRETIDIVRVADGRAVEHWGARA